MDLCAPGAVDTSVARKAKPHFRKREIADDGIEPVIRCRVL